ncbi:protein kinase domain-containing protein [Desulfogranum japonicum]|uniref:protein kinase domain-containing protein n=1 Tax=Desulfogranum japonicum TaxID=231447 RepID=UPI0013770B59|nr:protein kinase [Desulfogranum japonicum]
MEKKIGKYTIIRRLGKGGMGSVYKGLVPEIDKVVAIKLLDPLEVMEDVLGYDKLREIFIFEARTMASFAQPFLVTAHDFAEDEKGRPFFVMEYLCKNLGDMIGEAFEVEKDCRVIPATKVLDYGLQILQALAFLHHRDIVHRDIKPQNILVTDDDTLKICDFGMALVEGVAFSGPDTMQVGSPYYTPPEQRKSPSTVDGRADLYAAAVLLYRMLTGKFPGMQSFSLSQVNPLYDMHWDAFFQKALSWDPDLRFQDARSMSVDLQKLRLHGGEQYDPDGHCLLADKDGDYTLRQQPLNVCRSKAAASFGLNERFRPLKPICNRITINDDLIFDAATGLSWKRQSSLYPLTLEQAEQYVQRLNNEQQGEETHWRLPTMDELLSLLGSEGRRILGAFLPEKSTWLWSCDLHGKHEAWFLNLDMRYAGTQDINCLNYVRPVCTINFESTQYSAQ